MKFAHNAKIYKSWTVNNVRLYEFDIRDKTGQWVAGGTNTVLGILVMLECFNGGQKVIE